MLVTFFSVVSKFLSWSMRLPFWLPGAPSLSSLPTISSGTRISSSMDFWMAISLTDLPKFWVTYFQPLGLRGPNKFYCLQALRLFFPLLDPRPTEGPIKSQLSVCPLGRHFSQKYVVSFFMSFCTMVDNWNI